MICQHQAPAYYLYMDKIFCGLGKMRKIPVPSELWGYSLQEVKFITEQLLYFSVQWSYKPAQQKASRFSRYEHFYFRHSIGFSEGQSAYLNASIYNESKPAELKLCTEWHRTQHSFREVREITPVILIGHCGWRLGNFMLYYCI